MTRIAVTGSIATDFLMTFPAKFTDQLIADKLATLSLSFLVDDLTIHRGGAGANIAYGLGNLGLLPTLIGSVGADFDDSWLTGHGVDTASIFVSSTRYTARFMCVTDVMQNQIATFYAGAMQDARNISLANISNTAGPFDLIVVSPNDPAAMVRHTAECRTEGYRFVADPSQQLARLDRKDVRSLISGAAYLFTNEYENALLRERSGWTATEIRDQVGLWVTTRDSRGVRIERRGHEVLDIAAAPPEQVLDPTGAGDGFRSGFLFGMARRIGVEESAKLGCVVAAIVLESAGAQSYQLSTPALAGRCLSAYGSRFADVVQTLLTPTAPLTL